MSFNGQVFSILSVFISIIGVIFVLHILLLLLQYTIAGFLTKKNPLKLLFTMLPAYFTALGTQSSAATIPRSEERRVGKECRSWWLTYQYKKIILVVLFCCV